MSDSKQISSIKSKHASRLESDAWRTITRWRSRLKLCAAGMPGEKKKKGKHSLCQQFVALGAEILLIKVYTPVECRIRLPCFPKLGIFSHVGDGNKTRVRQMHLPG